MNYQGYQGYKSANSFPFIKYRKNDNIWIQLKNDFIFQGVTSSKSGDWRFPDYIDDDLNNFKIICGHGEFVELNKNDVISIEKRIKETIIHRETIWKECK